MITPDVAVRTAVYGLLSAAGIAAYDSEAPVEAVPPYILLVGQTNTDFTTKSGYGFFHDITLSAVNVAPSASGREVPETLLNQALTALTTQQPGQPVKIDLSPDFRCWMVRAGQTKDVTFTGATESVYQKIVTLTLSIDYTP